MVRIKVNGNMRQDEKKRRKDETDNDMKEGAETRYEQGKD